MCFVVFDAVKSRRERVDMKRRCLCHQLNDTTGLLDLLLRQLAHPPRAHDERDLGKAALAEDLGVAEGEEVEDGDGVLLGAGNVGIAGLSGDEGPELVEVDDGLPEVVLLLVEVPHTNLTEVTRMVLVHVGTVVVLTTGKTTTTGVLAVLAYTSMTVGDVAAVLAGLRSAGRHGDKELAVVAWGGLSMGWCWEGVRS